MGENKALLDFQGQSLISIMIQKMTSVFDEVVIVSNREDYGDLDCQVISDQIMNAGPAGGIHSVLNHTTTEYNFIISCDMPFVTKAGIEFMINQSKNYDISIPQKNGFIEPLFGVYSKNCRNKWEELIRSNHFKLSDFLPHFKTNMISVDNNKIFGSDFFMNVNTKTDYLTALKMEKHDH